MQSQHACTTCTATDRCGAAKGATQQVTDAEQLEDMQALHVRLFRYMLHALLLHITDATVTYLFTLVLPPLHMQCW